MFQVVSRELCADHVGQLEKTHDIQRKSRFNTLQHCAGYALTKWHKNKFSARGESRGLRPRYPAALLSGPEFKLSRVQWPAKDYMFLAV